MSRPKHRAAFINSVVDDEVVVIFREEVFRLKVHPAFLRSRTDLLTVLDKASVLRIDRFSKDLTCSGGPWTYRLLFSSLLCLDQRVVVLADMETEEMIGREVLVTFGAAVGVDLSIVHLESLESVKGKDLSMRG